MKPLGFKALLGQVRQVFADLPDRRTGDNSSYAMADFGLAAFSVFFTQSPSFLAHQKSMQKVRGRNNAQSLFGLGRIPSDNRIRQILDPVPPEKLHPVFDYVFDALRQARMLEGFRGVYQSTLIALDGTGYHSSKKIHCPHCSRIKQANGEVCYRHTAVTPVVVAPGRPEVFALRPEFIVPQDGHDKQDCEIAAAKRWIQQGAERFGPGPLTLLGDDLFAHQPFCRQALLYGFHFIFTAKAESHPALTQWVSQLQPGPDLRTVRLRIKSEGHWQTHLYRFANQVPLVEGEDALKVNWCEVTITDAKGEVRYHNTFVTDWLIDEKNVVAVVASGRARWKIENENNNVLKTKGYHFEHNFGHGQQHLSSLLAAMNLLAFLFHTVLGLTDEAYRLVRATLPTRGTFFDDLRALTRYIHFPSWQGLLRFMMRGLEIGPYAKKV